MASLDVALVPMCVCMQTSKALSAPVRVCVCMCVLLCVCVQVDNRAIGGHILTLAATVCSRGLWQQRRRRWQSGTVSNNSSGIRGGKRLCMCIACNALTDQCLRASAATILLLPLQILKTNSFKCRPDDLKHINNLHTHKGMPRGKHHSHQERGTNASFDSQALSNSMAYQHKHALHRLRRLKTRHRDLVISFLPRLRTPIISRYFFQPSFFNRYGKQEQEVLACFDFLDELIPDCDECPENYDIYYFKADYEFYGSLLEV